MIYSELRSDTDLLNDLEDAKRVFLIGCPACANMSLYIAKADETKPVMTITPTGFKPVSMTEEVDRLSNLFASKGLDVGFWVGKYPLVTLCVTDEGIRSKLSEKCQEFETVVTLACDAGAKSVAGILTGKRIIPAMNASGIVNALSRRQMGYARIFVDKGTVDIIPFTFKS
ncbi:hypothetical protein ACFL0Q_06845 [Thermodesulfobacteriota bacterium]